MPMTIKSGAGRQTEEVERCAGLRQTEAPAVQIVETEADQDDRRRREHDTCEIDRDIRPPVVRLQPGSSEEDDRRQNDQDAEGGPPTDEGAEHTADHECRDAGAGACRTECAQGGRLLEAVIIFCDQRD